MKLDKLKIILMSILMVFSIGAMGVYDLVNKEEEVKIDKTDAVKFKEEYESLNNKQVRESENTYKEMEIPKNNPFVYATYEDIFEALENTAVIYFGYPECPWCRSLVPLLIQASKKVGMGKIYYINMKEERNVLYLEDGKIIEEKPGSEGYNTLLSKLDAILPTYEGLEEDSIKRIYVPYVLFVKEGEVVATHTGTLDTQENPYTSLTEEEKTELLSILVDKFMKVVDTSCDSAC